MQYPINREIKIGTNPEGHAVTLEIEIKHHAQEKTTTGAPIVKMSTTMQPVTDYKSLSICGSSRRQGGQMQDTIREELDSYQKLLLPKPSIIRILDIWDAYHLNDMKAACVHQTALGWDSGKKISFEKYSIDWDTRRSFERALEKTPGHVAASWLWFLSKNKIQPFGFVAVDTLQLAQLHKYFEPIPAHELKAYNEKRRIEQAERLAPRMKPPILREVETKSIGWVRPEDHGEGVLGKACPECGYKYGSAWLVGALPEEIEQEVLSLCDSAPIESRTETSQDDQTAAKLAEWGVKFRATKQNAKCPPWHQCKETENHIEHHGFHYRVTFWRGRGKRFAFDFWTSQHDSAEGKEPTANDVLGCLTFSEPGCFKYFCLEAGYSEDSREAERVHKAVIKEWRKVCGFFTASEVNELREMF